MTRVAALLSQPTEMAYSDVVRLLAHFGFNRARQKGSHCTFKHADGRSVGFPRAGGHSVKRPYLNMIAKVLRPELGG